MSKVRKSDGDKRVQVHCELKHQTEKAWLIVVGADEWWIPKVLGDFEPETDDGVVGVLEVAKWFAEKEDLPY